jgi:hypothetical protein
MFVAVLVSVISANSVFVGRDSAPDAVVLGTAVSVVGMLTGALWLAVRWNGDRDPN